MNKEIEETRKAQESLKQLTAYMETIAQQLRDRGLFYVFAVADKKNGTMLSGIECASSHMPLLVSDIVSRTMTALARDGMETRKKLAGQEPTWEDK